MTTTSSSRRVCAHIELQVTEVADLVLSIAVATDAVDATEQLTVTSDGQALPAEAIEEIVATDGTRLHRLAAAPVGQLVVDYTATVAPGASERPVSPLEAIVFTRPSRYCDSDRLAAVTATHFGGLAGAELVAAVTDWVYTQIAYTPGSSQVTDGALEAYLSRTGVCRDMAQLVVTFLRASGMPARLVSVYAPGLSPMDFHAVAEVALDGTWRVIDATRLAPRASMVRIATGRDAADTAFLTVNAGRADLVTMSVFAVADPDLPVEDTAAVVSLS